jgi:tetratricopeptide (TPR) repeat protein
MALERAGRIAEALAEYRRAVDVDPGFAAAHEALGYHYQRRGLLMKACDAFQTVARLEGHYNAYFNLGFILVELERYEEALEVFHQCLALIPDDPAALYEIAYVHYVMGQLVEATAALRIPLASYGNDWRVYNLLGACNLGLGHWQAAETEYQQALQFAASPVEAEEAGAGLQVAQRYQEFAVGAALGFKERAYADAGLVVLGTAGDDGLQIALHDRLKLTPALTAVTLQRLQVLVEALDLGLTAVVAVDRDSAPLAAALGSLLALPRKRLLQLPTGERPLLVLRAGRQPELLQVALEQAPRGALSFILALEWYGENDLLPDVIGVPVRQVILPGRTPGDERQVRLATRALLDACAVSSDEPGRESQVRFYREHRRLRLLE